MNRVPFSGILGPTYTLESLNAECQRCVNMLPERVESSNGKDAFWLKPTPGLELFCALPTGPVRRPTAGSSPSPTGSFMSWSLTGPTPSGAPWS
jgi:hypothetical protein